MTSDQKSQKNDRIKVVLIIVLSIIFVIVAYFRFFHNKSIRATNNPVAMTLTTPLTVPTVYQAGAETGKMDERPGEGAPVGGMVTRNIFAPAKTAGTGGEPSLMFPEKADGKTVSGLKLSGIITDDRAAIAVINGKFLKKGDAIEGYQVIGIGDKTVTLSGNGLKIVLNILANTDK